MKIAPCIRQFIDDVLAPELASQTTKDLEALARRYPLPAKPRLRWRNWGVHFSTMAGECWDVRLSSEPDAMPLVVISCEKGPSPSESEIRRSLSR